MNWPTLAAAAVLPLLIALPVAALFWRRRRSSIGTVLGIGVVLVAAVGFMALEYGEGLHYRALCAEQNLPCPPSKPSDFVKIFSYGLVGMADVMLVFLVGSGVEARQQRRRRSVEWR